MYNEPKMEKLTVNLPPVELARIDVLVEAGVYPSRTEFMRTAIRKSLDEHQKFIDIRIEELQSKYDDIDQGTDEKKYLRYMGMGVFHIDKNSLDKAIIQGKQLKIFVIGLVAFDKQISVQMIKNGVHSIRVFGVLKASKAVKEALEAKKVRG
jgi:Arc/MetJ-type ribon-helix-helix transcriptional regulator